MSRVMEYMHKFHTTSKKAFVRQVHYKIRGKIIYSLYHLHDSLFDTRRQYREAGNSCVPFKIESAQLDVAGIDSKMAGELWRMYKSHRFDLLGSGWIQNGFVNNAPGLDGHRYDSVEIATDPEGEFLRRLLKQRNFKSSREIWKQISPSYKPIDWQKDYKSGYRWGADQWYRPQGNAKKPGGDIKVPWELARLQHLPRLAIIAWKLPEYREEIFAEFCNQLLDFIAQNPPRMGVNYMCTMDVGIRTANIALAYTLFRNMDILFSKQIEQIITNFMFQQCNHIRRNLEWSDIFTSNHYFADIAGLLYGSAILPECKKRDRWLTFAVEQVKQEIEKQFYAEGTNKEGSTAYHRLMGEMAVYSLALIHYLAEQGKCKDAEDTLYGMIEQAGLFIERITRPDGTFTQIGDNDSGLFFRLSITGELLTASEAANKYQNLQNYIPESKEECYLDECMNDGRTFCSAVYGLCKEPKLQGARNIYPLESSLIAQLMCGSNRQIAAKTVIPEEQTEIMFSDFKYHSAYEVTAQKDNLLEDLHKTCYPFFGIYIYRSKELYLCINASDNGQKGNGGHAHNDKLSFELFINGKCIFEDSGVYVYTPLPEERNRFRSIQMHNTIYAGVEQSEYINLFSMKSGTVCRCIRWRDREAVLEVRYKNVIHIRQFQIKEAKICIDDYCNVPFEPNWRSQDVTCGYGKKKKNNY